MTTAPMPGPARGEPDAAAPADRPEASPHPARSPVLSGLGPALLLGLVLAAFAASRLAIAGVPSEREYDEGVYLMSARAVIAGHELFTEVFSSQPPAFVETLALALAAFGDCLAVARGLILAFALLSLLAVADIARRLAGAWAAPAAAAALALSMTFGDLAHVVEAETPAMALALLSLAACLEARRRGWSRGWLVAAGALYGLAALYKLIVVPLAAPFGLLLLLAPPADDESGWRPDASLARVLLRSATVAAGAALVLALPLLRYDAEAYFAQAVGFHLSKHDVFHLNELANVRRAVGHLRADAILVATACAGLLLMTMRRQRLAAAWLAVWLVFMVAAISVQTPIFWRHFVLLSPPIAIAAGAAAALAAGRNRRRAGAVAVAAMAVWTAVTLARGRGLFPLTSDGARNDRALASLQEAARWIAMNTREDELVGGDDPMAIYLGGRRTPAGLCDVSSARIVSESLLVEEAARASLEARVIVMRSGGRLSKLPGYFGWLKKNYDARPASLTGLGPQRSVWIRREGATANATSPPSLRGLGDLNPPTDESPGN